MRWAMNALASIALAGLGLQTCGGEPSEAETKRAIAAVANATLEALSAGDGAEACAHLTPRGRRILPEIFGPRPPALI